MLSILGIFFISVLFIAAVLFFAIDSVDILSQIFYGAVEVNTIVIVVFILFLVFLLFAYIRDIITYVSFISICNSKNNIFTKYFPNRLQQLSDLVLDKKSISQHLVDDNTDFAIGQSLDTLRALPSIMISIGLLGTFIGLSITIAEVADLMSKIGGNIDVEQKIEALFTGLPKAIEGMKLAFYTSLYGLGTSLISSVLLAIYYHGLANISNTLRSYILNNGLLDSEQNIDKSLIKAATILNKQTSIFANVVQTASRAIERQSEYSHQRLDELLEQNKTFNNSINTLTKSMSGYNEADKLLANTNINLLKVIDNLTSLNITSKDGFASVRNSINQTQDKYDTASIIKILERLDSSAKDGFAGIKNGINSISQSESIKYDTLNNNLKLLLEKYKDIFENNKAYLSSQESIVNQFESIADSVAAIKNVLTSVDNKNNEFSEEISNINTQILAIDTYIKSIDTPNTVSKNNRKWFGIFK